MKQAVLVLLLTLTGCSYIKKTVPIHPGAISNLDSYAYDILLTEQAAINQARSQYLGNTLPAAAKGPLNVAIDQYNSTMKGWQSYHANGQGETTLQQALDALVKAVGELEKVLQHTPSNVPATTGWIHTGRLEWA